MNEKVFKLPVIDEICTNQSAFAVLTRYLMVNLKDDDRFGFGCYFIKTLVKL